MIIAHGYDNQLINQYVFNTTMIIAHGYDNQSINQYVFNTTMIIAHGYDKFKKHERQNTVATDKENTYT